MRQIWRKRPQFVFEFLERPVDLLHFGEDGGTFGGAAGGADADEEEAGEHADDRDHDHHLDEREGRLPFQGLGLHG